MDLESIHRWEDYSRAKDVMMARTDTKSSPWYVVESDVKKHARLNMIAHLLSTIPYQDVAPEARVQLPDRLTSTSNYQRPPRELSTYVPDHAAALR
jgi:polyphosphate kinase